MLKYIPSVNHYSGAIEAVRKHLHHEGASLCNLLEALDEPCGVDALIDLNMEFGKSHPRAPAIQDALQIIQELLGNQSFEYLELLGRAMNYPTLDATRWHGAKVSDLLAGFL